MKNKPWGMQTFLDKMIQYFVFSHGSCNVAAAIAFGVFQVTGPVNALVAQVVAWVACILAIVFLYSTFTVLAVR